MANQAEVFNRPIAYEEGDKVVYRASSLGMCDGALVRARLGVTGSAPSDLMQSRFDEGHDWEERVLIAGLGVDWMDVQLRDHLELLGSIVEGHSGTDADDRLQIETEIAWSNKVVRCHPDAIAVHRGNGEQRVVEVKFLGEEMADEKVKAVAKLGMLGLGPTYAWQASVEMLSTGLPMLYLIGVKQVEGEGDARKVVGIGDLHVLEWDEPCYSLKDVKARVLGIEGYVTRGEMPTCPTPFMYPCPYWAEHEAVEKQELDDADLVYAVETWKKAKHNEVLAARDTDAAKEDVRKAMERLGLTEGRCAGVDVAVVEAAEQGNVSWASWAKKVKKLHPEVADVSEDEFRGKPREGYVRLTEVKEKD